MAQAREHDRTDVEPRTELDLVALRQWPRLDWTDAAGPHTRALEGRLLLGSSPQVALAVADRAVSRLHAELELRPDGVWVRDLGSRNGTWVDGVLVQSARIPPGGRLRVGGTTITVSLGTETSTVPLWPHDTFGPMKARSVVMRELFLRLSQYAATDSAVLVHGETGTGKELVARALHDVSPRADGPFVVVDCAALPETLLESELFGHARGAFTGATHARAGAFEAAHGGTVFLDEIGELPLAMQPKLLRVLESQTIRRVGETEHRKVDVRFVSATHRDLEAMVASGAFREDLYFRVAVLPVHVPALRARPDDVPLLLDHFLARSPVRLTGPLLEELARHPWTGNVRELRSFAERAVAVGPESAWAMTRGAETSAPSRRPPAPSAAPPSRGTSGFASPLPAIPTNHPFKVLREEWLDHFEREYIAGLVAVHGRDTAAIARAAELDRSYVHRLLRKHDL